MAIPVSLEAAKRQLRYSDDETLPADRVAEINDFIADAAGWVEAYTGHILVARDVTETFTGFDRLALRAWPVKPAAVPVVTYADAASQAVVVTTVKMAGSLRPARVVQWAGSRWPGLPLHSTISVTVRAGYEDGDTVPTAFRRAMLVLISAYDADREGGEVYAAAEVAARRTCSSFRMRTL